MSTKGKKKPDKQKPKKKDYKIQLKASGATIGTTLKCLLSGFEPQEKVSDDTTTTFNFQTKKGKPEITEGQALAGDINGQVFNVTVSGKFTKTNISLNSGVNPPPP